MKKYLVLFIGLFSLFLITDNVSALTNEELYNDHDSFVNHIIDNYDLSSYNFSFTMDYSYKYFVTGSYTGDSCFYKSGSLLFFPTQIQLFRIYITDSYLLKTETPRLGNIGATYLKYHSFDIYTDSTCTEILEPANITHNKKISKGYDYTVNYYFNNVIDESKTETGTAEEGITINFTDYSSNIYELSDEYDYNFVINTNDNTFNVYYSYKSFDYTINYYFDNELDNEKTFTSHAMYDSIISYEDYSNEFYEFSSTSPDSFKITENENIFNVFYTSILYDYTINYYFNGVLDESKTEIGQAKYNDVIAYTDYSNYFYKYDTEYEINTTISKENNVFNIYLVETDNIVVEESDSLLSDIAHQLLGDDIPEEFNFIYMIIEFIIAIIFVISLLSPFIIAIWLIKAVL